MSVVTAWRIVPVDRADSAFSGAESKRYGGRFHSEGVSVVHSSESVALAQLELLIRTNERRILENRICIPVSFAERLVTSLAPEDLPGGWNARPYEVEAQRLGDEWVRSGSSPILRVPSVVVPTESNYLIDPANEAFDELEIGDPVSMTVDPRTAE